MQKSKLIMAVAQMRPAPGNVRENLKNIRLVIAQARISGAHIVVLPELITSGYILGDRWEYNSFVREIEEANETICEESGNGSGITVVWGSLRIDWDRVGEDGRVRKYNAAMIASNGKWVENGALVGWVPKTNMPGYGIFDDSRYFYPAAKLAVEKKMPLEKILSPFVVSFGDKEISLALTVCEDTWDDAYASKPAQIYREQGVDLLINISCSPWTVGKRRARERMLKARVKDSGLPILYVNSVGLQNNTKNLVWFDGRSIMIDGEGVVRWRAKAHEEGLFLLSMDNFPEVRALGSLSTDPHDSDTEDAFNAIVHAMRSFFPKGKKVIIGLSGGIDSAVSAALLVEALGKENILSVNMPTEYNSQTTQTLAKQCAGALDIEYRVVPIQKLYNEQLSALADAGYTNPAMLVKENIQARIRGQQLASIAACEDGLFVNNGNKTEVALNYFTLYGDAAGAASFLGDLWKGQVYDLARFMNMKNGMEVIPQGIIDIVPSAELSAEQNVDEGRGDPIFYEYHDELLRMFTEERWDITTVMERLIKGTLEEDLGCIKGTLMKYFPTATEMIKNLEWAWWRYNIEFKRVQLPPVFITSRRAFGFDRRDTIADAHISSVYHYLKKNYLQSTKEGGWKHEQPKAN